MNNTQSGTIFHFKEGEQMRKSEAVRRLSVFIETYRKMRGYNPTQKECAEYLRVSQSYVSRILSDCSNTPKG